MPKRSARSFWISSADWEKELSEFHNTDVEVPAKLTVDGKVYPNVGVHFRGASSHMMVSSEGRKRSLNVSVDFVDENQRLSGLPHAQSAELARRPDLPAHGALLTDIARQYLPRRKRISPAWSSTVSWGVYVNDGTVQQGFHQGVVRDDEGRAVESVRQSDGAGRVGISRRGRRRIQKRFMTSNPRTGKSWADLIQLCKVLNETPTNKLEETLAPLLDIGWALKFLALENALINNDGYWMRAVITAFIRM